MAVVFDLVWLPDAYQASLYLSLSQWDGGEDVMKGLVSRDKDSEIA